MRGDRGVPAGRLQPEAFSQPARERKLRWGAGGVAARGPLSAQHLLWLPAAQGSGPNGSTDSSESRQTRGEARAASSLSSFLQTL